MAKTELMIIGSRQRLNAHCEEIDISIDDKTIKRDLTIDAQLSRSKHVDEICKKASSAIGALKRVRPFISTDVAKITKSRCQSNYLLIRAPTSF